MKKTRIILIYYDYDSDKVDQLYESLHDQYGQAKIYHIDQDRAIELYKEATAENRIDKVFFTKTLSEQNKKIFLGKPYNGQEMS